MFDKLEALEERFQLVSEKISDPDIIADQESWRKYCKEHSDLTPIIDKYRELKSAKQTVADDKEMLEAGQDKEFEEMIRLEMAEAEETIERASEELKILLLPKDPNDEKNVIMEIRGGTGGDEAALFAADLMRMYSMYAESKNWKIDILSSKPYRHRRLQRSQLFNRKDKVHTADLNLKVVYTEFREFPKQNQAEEFILPPLR